MKQVWYHAGCNDGFLSALILWQMLGDDGVQYVPVKYNEPPPPHSQGDLIWIVDFSYPKDILVGIGEQTGSPLTVIDHHKTAKDELTSAFVMNPLTAIIFDLDKSGCRLTWEYMCDALGKHWLRRLPTLLVEAVEDRDLWRWKHTYSREVYAGLSTLPMKFEAWAPYMDNTALPRLVEIGTAVLRYQQQAVERMTAHSAVQWVDIGGYRVPAVNATILVSEVGEALNKKFPNAPFAGVYRDVPGWREWSLRSQKEGIDCGVIAKGYDGGGHPGAAGFKQRIILG